MKEIERRRRERISFTLREIEEDFSVPLSMLHRASKTAPCAKELLKLSRGRGTHQDLAKSEEQMIVYSAIEYQSNGAILDRGCLCLLSKALIGTIDDDRQKNMQFRNDTAGTQ